MEFLWVFFAVIIITIAAAVSVRRVTVFEYERGLKYVKGKFRSVVQPGQHWYMPFFGVIEKIDIRPRFVSIAGQEVLSADGVTLKVSLAANFEIVDPNVAINRVQSYQEALYLELQLALREIIGGTEIDNLLAGRAEMSKKLMAIAEPKAAKLGLKLISVDLKDIMFPGKLKEVFAQVVNARKEGAAALEKARGETAALRNLANAARMVDDNPNLMQLRLLQALGDASGNTVILGMPPQSTPVPVPSQRRGKELTDTKREGSEPDGQV